MMRLGGFIVGSLLAAQCMATSVAESHPRRVGVVEAVASQSTGRVTILFKLEVQAVSDHLATAGARWNAPTTAQGRRDVVALLNRSHELSSWSGPCTQQQTNRYGLSPSGRWIDVELEYLCPLPMEYVAIHVSLHLGEPGLRLAGRFGKSRVVFNRRAQTHFLLFED